MATIKCDCGFVAMTPAMAILHQESCTVHKLAQHPEPKHVEGDESLIEDTVDFVKELLSDKEEEE